LTLAGSGPEALKVLPLTVKVRPVIFDSAKPLSGNVDCSQTALVPRFPLKVWVGMLTGLAQNEAHGLVALPPEPLEPLDTSDRGSLDEADLFGRGRGTLQFGGHGSR
jgi:hypothetical protein